MARRRFRSSTAPAAEKRPTLIFRGNPYKLKPRVLRCFKADAAFAVDLAEDFAVRVKVVCDDPENEDVRTYTYVGEIRDTAEAGRVQIIRAPAADAKYPARAAFTRFAREAARNAPKAHRFKGVAVTRETLPDGRLRVTWLNGAGAAVLVPGIEAEKVIAKIEGRAFTKSLDTT